MAGHRRAGPSGASGDDGGGGGDSESKSEDPFHVRNWSENPTNIAVSSRAAAVCAVNESTLSNPAVSLALGDRPKLSKRWRGFTACVDALVIGDGNLQAACKLGDNVVALCKSNAAASGADWNQLFSTAVGDRKWRRIKADLRQQDHKDDTADTATASRAAAAAPAPPARRRSTRRKKRGGEARGGRR